MELKRLYLEMQTVTVFRGVLQNPAVAALCRFLGALDANTTEKVGRYCDFAAELYRSECDLSALVLSLVTKDDNPYIRLLSQGKNAPAFMTEQVKRELYLLEELSALPARELAAATGYDGRLPEYFISPIDNFYGKYFTIAKNVSKNGFGIFADNIMFHICGGEIVPIRPADPISVSSLFGYEIQREAILANTKALLRGQPAANMLLCGDAGTGKSSTVKAIVNMLAPEGLRLVELQKNQLYLLPEIIEKLRENPLKFIMFVDDLSFRKNDDDFNGLKAILEGSACVKSPNTAVYATSNRRHLVKESFAEREGSDIHKNDTIQETMSLSERFGLTVQFSMPSKELYLHIVQKLADSKGITLPSAELFTRAEQFALEKGGRSARAAEQFTNFILTQA